MVEMSLQQVFGLAMQHHNSGRLQEAENLFRQIIALDPNHADALHMLGVIARRTGNNQAAIDLIRRALAIKPGCANANFNLGNALRDQGQLDDAITAYRRAISLGQNLAQAYHNLGCLLRDEGMLEDAIAAFSKAQEATAAAATPKPDRALDWFNLGNSLAEKWQFAEAITAYQRAISIQPDFAEAHCNVGNALVEEEQLEAAIAAYRQSIGLNPNLPQAHFNLGKALYDQGQLDQAIIANRQAIALRPGYAAAYRNLASCLFEAGQLDDAIATNRQSPRDDEATSAKIDSDLIFMLHFHPDYDAQSIAEETRRWNQRYAEPLAGLVQPHLNDQTPDRRLRIGYVSPDFRQHVVGKNLVPLFARHNHEQFEIICYSNAARPDAMTQWFQKHADGWRDVAGLSDDQLASQIRNDRIDILVDLALHTQDNRLLTFARKPAPVQMTFAGYPGSTGLTAIDYRLSDPYLDPPGADASVYSEQTLRLPHSFWCYDPGDCRDIAVNPLPARDSGIITFGCLNNFCKINNAVLDLWAKVMQQVEGSRLLLLAKHGHHWQRTIDHLSQHHVDPQRIEFLSFAPRREYLQQYHRVDISLDTFPYNGHTTSLDSLWMGVPVVTLVGQTAVGRAGWCQLSNLGLTELAGHSFEQFVQIAVDLAKDLPRLEQLRSMLRTQKEHSPLMDAATFAGSIETAYCQMWQQWCS
jgi:predicted O-linked N-acetylglucosamine transferase (SPINDLY family)